MRSRSLNGHWTLLALSLLAGGVPTAGCRRSPEPAPGEGAAQPAPSTPPAAPVSAASANVPPAPSTEVPPAPAPCRALRVTGKVRTEDGKALATQDDLDGARWLELDKGSEVVVRHGVSARELSLFGPGRAWPCRFGQEQVLLAEGKLESSPGTGVRPGAEVWVATPFGSLRYADAKLQLTSSRDGLQLVVRSGQAFTESIDGVRGARDDGQVTGPNGRATVRGRPDPEAAVKSCEHAAQLASESAQQVLKAKPEELGKLAAAQLRTRRLARGRCLAAEASVAGLADPVKKARLGDQVQRADAQWQGVPAAPSKGL